MGAGGGCEQRGVSEVESSLFFFDEVESSRVVLHNQITQ